MPILTQPFRRAVRGRRGGAANFDSDGELMTFKAAMGGLSVCIMFVAYGVYLWQASRARGVEPHPFSWLLWGTVTGVAYLVQATHDAAAGSWVVGLTAIMCLVIGTFSLIRHKWKFLWFDWLSLGAGIMVFAYYLLTKNPTRAAILATITDVVGYASTVRRGWVQPMKDSVTSFALNSAKFLPAILALNSYTIATYLYPGTLVVVNALVAIMLVWRRLRVSTATPFQG